MLPRTLVAAVVIAAAAGASAQSKEQPFFNVVTLEASASTEVPTDMLTVTLFTEEQGPDPAVLATRINARLEQALAAAKAQPRVDARSGNYQTSPVYDRGNQITGWRTRAEIVVESRDIKAVGALAGSLQPAMKLSAMVFSLSRSAREAAESSLLSEALARFQEKARAVAKALGFPGYMLGQITVRSDLPAPPVQPYRSMAMSVPEGAASAPVPAEGGRNGVAVHVSGSVVLGPGK